MALSTRQAARARAEPIATGRKTHIGNGYNTTLTPTKSRTRDVLRTLRGISDEVTAIEYLKGVNPDVSMAVWNFVRLSNQGNQMVFYSADGKTRLNELESEWRQFASRINEVSNSGLDGLIDQLHYSSFVLGAMAAEVDVEEGRKDIYDVYPLKPQTIEWELETVDGRPKYTPYQISGFEKIPLGPGHANFFWVPSDPELGDPRGTLNLSPVLQAVDFQMQILQDLQAVLHHQGYPKNDISIDVEKLLSTCPNHIRNDQNKVRDWLDLQVANIRRALENMNPDSDYVHTNDVTINMNQGANAARSLDVRAVNELVDTQTLSGLKQMAIFMNRNTGVTESWGTVQFRIYCNGIESCQRGSKRIVEEIARLWLRVKGIQATPKFTHNTIDWNSEEQRMTVDLMKQEFYVTAQMMGWIDADTAASEVMKAEGAVGEPSENIRISFSSGGERIDNHEHQKQGKEFHEGTA